MDETGKECILAWFHNQISGLNKYTALEIGTRRWGSNSTHHKVWFPKAKKIIMTDFIDGEDVDVVADAHQLSKTFGEGAIDVIVAASVFEHLKKPWIVAEEILKTLKPGGLFFVQTHHTFPVHGYPNDYFRYTTAGLETLFEKASELHSQFEFPATIKSERLDFTLNPNSWLNVCITGKR